MILSIVRPAIINMVLKGQIPDIPIDGQLIAIVDNDGVMLMDSSGNAIIEG